MTVGLIDVDGHHFPNLVLMKLSAWHKAQGDQVGWYEPMQGYVDRIYMSKVFTFTPDYEWPLYSEDVRRGGTGYFYPDGGNPLPQEVEHIMPDYSLYGITNTAYGFLTRGCPRGCPFCVVADKEGKRSVKVADLSEWWNGQKNIELMDPNILACPQHLDLLKQLAQSKAWVNINQGADCRLLTRENIDALNSIKIKMLHFAWDLMSESEAVLRGLNLYAQYGCLEERKRRVYVLVNYNTTIEENLYRIYKLRELKYDPYVMVYDKHKAPKDVKKLQRWVNNKIIWRACERFEDYKS